MFLMYRVELKELKSAGLRAVRVLWRFLMYRVELKVMLFWGVFTLLSILLWFLMYRVELKDGQECNVSARWETVFLMYRVELKANSGTEISLNGMAACS